MDQSSAVVPQTLPKIGDPVVSPLLLTAAETLAPDSPGGGEGSSDNLVNADDDPTASHLLFAPTGPSPQASPKNGEDVPANLAVEEGAVAEIPSLGHSSPGGRSKEDFQRILDAFIDSERTEVLVQGQPLSEHLELIRTFLGENLQDSLQHYVLSGNL